MKHLLSSRFYPVRLLSVSQKVSVSEEIPSVGLATTANGDTDCR